MFSRVRFALDAFAEAWWPANNPQNLQSSDASYLSRRTWDSGSVSVCVLIHGSIFSRLLAGRHASATASKATRTRENTLLSIINHLQCCYKPPTCIGNSQVHPKCLRMEVFQVLAKYQKLYTKTVDIYTLKKDKTICKFVLIWTSNVTDHFW